MSPIKAALLVLGTMLVSATSANAQFIATDPNADGKACENPTYLKLITSGIACVTGLIGGESGPADQITGAIKTGLGCLKTGLCEYLENESLSKVQVQALLSKCGFDYLEGQLPLMDCFGFVETWATETNAGRDLTSTRGGSRGHNPSWEKRYCEYNPECCNGTYRDRRQSRPECLKAAVKNCNWYGTWPPIINSQKVCYDCCKGSMTHLIPEYEACMNYCRERDPNHKEGASLPSAPDPQAIFAP